MDVKEEYGEMSESEWTGEEGDAFHRLVYAEVMGEYEESGEWVGSVVHPRSDGGHDDLSSSNKCVCDPCLCIDESEEEENDEDKKCKCVGTCPCDEPENIDETGRAEIEEDPSPQPELTPDSDSKDEMDSFVKKLEKELVRNQKQKCRSVFPRLKRPKLLTEGTVLDLLLKDPNGKSVIYLPGNQLCPKILSERLGNRDMRVIFNVMGGLPDVTTISVPYNLVGDDGIEILASVLERNPSVEHLNVMNNEITGRGLVGFCMKLMKREPLLSLRLSGNKFGDEGYDALSCLVLSGHIPLDLDVSETDMGVGGFQAFCTALAALDSGEDFPPHYASRNKALPVDLETLKECKTEYNDNVHKMNTLKADEKNGSAKLYKLDIPKELMPTGNPEKVPPLPEFLTPKIAAKFSATVLETLFDISQRKELGPPDSAQLEKDYPPDKVTTMLCESLGVEDLDEFFASLTVKRPLKSDQVTNYREIPILSRDLYTIQPPKGIQHEFLHDVDDPEILRSLEAQGLIHYKGQLIDPADSILEKSHRDGTADSGKTLSNSGQVRTNDKVADGASKKYVKEVIEDAAAIAGASDVDDQSNVVQLVLMTVVEIVHRGQQARLAGGGDGTLSVDDCKGVTEEAIDRVMAILEPRVPIGCDLSPDTVRLFIETLFETTEGTFVNLLENPFIMEALHETGTLACHVQAQRGKKVGSEVKPVPASPDKIQYLVTRFVDGVLEEAGRIIGTGDPFNYRSLPNSKYLEKRDVDSNFDCCPAGTDPVTALVHDLFDMGQGIGHQTIVEAEDAKRAEQDALLAADIIVDNIFEAAGDFVTSRPEHAQHHLLAEEGKEENGIPSLRYPYVSRPTRLVLNRPLFHPGQVEVVAMMLGDYIKDNCSIKDLHIAKWQLNEAGMIALMEERLMDNRFLVFLDLSNNELGPDGVKLLATYITLNLNLKHLILSHNRLRDPGITHIASSIAMSNLESLNVAFNDLTEIGLDLLLAQIPAAPITTLYLWGNKFGLKTFELYKALLDTRKIVHTDTFWQEVDGVGNLVKNSQVRDTNYWYNVPASAGTELTVPPYLKKR